MSSKSLDLASVRACFLALMALMFVSMSTIHAADTPADKPYAVEYYYRVKWGHQDDFLRLYAKNHLPLLERHRKSGLILEMRTEEPRFHAALAHAYRQSGDSRRAERAQARAQSLTERAERAAERARDEALR